MSTEIDGITIEEPIDLPLYEVRVGRKGGRGISMAQRCLSQAEAEKVVEKILQTLDTEQYGVRIREIPRMVRPPRGPGTIPVRKPKRRRATKRT